MSDPIHNIDIPNGKPPLSAGEIICRALVGNGADPAKIFFQSEMGRHIVREWRDGAMTDQQFRQAIANLLILNPSLRLSA